MGNPVQAKSESDAQEAMQSFAASSDPTYTDMLETIHFLMDDRNKLVQQLTLAERAIQHFMAQSTYTSQLTKDSHRALELAKDPRTNRKPSDAKKPPTTWIASWLAPSVELLAPAEKAWQEGNPQRALNLVGSLLRRTNSTVSEDVEINLFMSALLRASDDTQAAKYAEDALVIANDAKDYSLICKAQFHRGMSFLRSGRFAQAQLCLVLASHLEGHAEQIGVNIAFAEEKVRNLDLDHPGRKVDLRLI
ncbi:MAG: hypothetical protein Q9174_002311 [Haloplaca sp. 1 TL-2023]